MASTSGNLDAALTFISFMTKSVEIPGEKFSHFYANCACRVLKNKSESQPHQHRIWNDTSSQPVILNKGNGKFFYPSQTHRNL